MTSPYSSDDEDDVQDEALHREVERLLEMWDEEPQLERWRRGGRGWS